MNERERERGILGNTVMYFSLNVVTVPEMAEEHPSPHSPEPKSSEGEVPVCAPQRDFDSRELLDEDVYQTQRDCRSGPSHTSGRYCLVMHCETKVRVTVESSFFMGIQCLWISQATLTDKLSCCKKFELSLKMCNEPNYQHTEVCPNELVQFGYWPPQIK